MNYQIKRNTEETQINISLANNGTQSHINTGVGFLDHMLTLFTFHSGLRPLEIRMLMIII